MKTMTDRILTVEDAKEFVAGKMDDGLLWFLDQNASERQLVILSAEDFEHIASCIKSIVADLFGLYGAGHFGQAVLANDLSSAVGRADEVNILALSLYDKFLHNCVPASLVQKRRRQKEKVMKINGMTIKWSRLNEKWQAISRYGKILEEFSKEDDAIAWARQTKDFIRKGQDEGQEEL